MKFNLTTTGLGLATVLIMASCGGEASTDGDAKTEQAAKEDAVTKELDTYEATINDYIDIQAENLPLIEALEDEVWEDDTTDDRIDEIYEEE